MSAIESKSSSNFKMRLIELLTLYLLIAAAAYMWLNEVALWMWLGISIIYHTVFVLVLIDLIQSYAGNRLSEDDPSWKADIWYLIGRPIRLLAMSFLLPLMIVHLILKVR